MESNKNLEKEKAIKEYYDEHKKSYTAGFMASLIFGPIGLFYSNWIAGLLLTSLGIFLAISFPLSLVIIWFISIVVGLDAVTSHNKKLMSKIKLNNALSI